VLERRMKQSMGKLICIEIVGFVAESPENRFSGRDRRYSEIYVKKAITLHHW
jgi:hypothetical protein